LLHQINLAKRFEWYFGTGQGNDAQQYPQWYEQAALTRHRDKITAKIWLGLFGGVIALFAAFQLC